MNELTFSFTDCAAVPQDAGLVIPAPVPEDQLVISLYVTAESAYTYMEKAARRFHGWLTISAVAVILSVVKAFRRIFSAVYARFNRTVFVRQGGLRL